MPLFLILHNELKLQLNHEMSCNCISWDGSRFLWVWGRGLLNKRGAVSGGGGVVDRID